MTRPPTLSSNAPTAGDRKSTRRLFRSFEERGALPLLDRFGVGAAGFVALLHDALDDAAADLELERADGRRSEEHTPALPIFRGARRASPAGSLRCRCGGLRRAPSRRP